MSAKIHNQVSIWFSLYPWDRMNVERLTNCCQKNENLLAFNLDEQLVDNVLNAIYGFQLRSERSLCEIYISCQHVTVSIRHLLALSRKVYWTRRRNSFEVYTSANFIFDFELWKRAQHDIYSLQSHIYKPAQWKDQKFNVICDANILPSEWSQFELNTRNVENSTKLPWVYILKCGFGLEAQAAGEFCFVKGDGSFTGLSVSNIKWKFVLPSNISFFDELCFEIIEAFTSYYIFYLLKGLNCQSFSKLTVFFTNVFNMFICSCD